jgi:hypothetical protein
LCRQTLKIRAGLSEEEKRDMAFKHRDIHAMGLERCVLGLVLAGVRLAEKPSKEAERLPESDEAVGCIREPEAADLRQLVLPGIAP